MASQHRAAARGYQDGLAETSGDGTAEEEGQILSPFWHCPTDSHFQLGGKAHFFFEAGN